MRASMTRGNAVRLHYACNVLRKRTSVARGSVSLHYTNKLLRKRPSMTRGSAVVLHFAYKLVRQHTLCPSSLFDSPLLSIHVYESRSALLLVTIHERCSWRRSLQDHDSLMHANARACVSVIMRYASRVGGLVRALHVP